jgi:hypothetical protein
MDDARMDHAMVQAANIEAAARYAVQTARDASEKKHAEDAVRQAAGLRKVLGRWIESRVAARVS